ncbi:BatD family protein [Leptospira jelokensis]|uniref:BatD family protein n=1 Tax=Leptospira jelokensis TaxID=2484931 RepID=UPI0010916570|nr:BatD family protein [Leptospira jelokensis]TGM06543.1 hypothetical protein EHQ79_00880 [Leptospira jelokensis]
MKNFGKNLSLILIFISFPFSQILPNEVEFYFHPDEFSLGEYAKLEIKAFGDKPFRVLQTSLKQNGVRVRYVGSGTETQIINLKVTKSQIINYYVDTETEGSFQLPEITVEYDQQKYTSPPIKFKVSKKTKHNPNGFMNPFPFEFDDNDTNEIPEVAFHTNKSVFYKGEPIVGYFVLYYSHYRQPFLERDPNHSISFPFFLSETLRQVSVQIEPEVLRNNTPKKTMVFAKEIYGLTALKSGTFTLGKTKFITGDSLRFNSIQETIETNPTKVMVLDLPNKSPKGFTGAIGNFKLKFISTPKQVYEGETAYFEVNIEGEGGFEGIKPMDFSNAKIKCISQTKSKTFQQLDSGEYGFYSKVKFLYSYQVLNQKKEIIEPYRFSFFSLSEKKYTTLELPFPEFQILPKRNLNLETIPQNTKVNLEWPFFTLVLLAIFGIFSYIGFKKYSFHLEIQTFVATVESFGKKRGFFLTEYLTKQGIPSSDSEWFTQILESDPNSDLQGLYKGLSSKDRTKVLTITKKIQPKE